MKTILIATDFSPSATNAMNYALDLAVNEPAVTILLHVSPTGDIEVEEEKLIALHTQILESKKIACERVLKEGDTVKEIIKVLEEKKPDLAVLGMKGESAGLQRLMGSTSREIIEHASCPVMVIPENAIFNQVHKITYATDYLESDIDAIKSLAEIAGPLRAEITLLHIAAQHRNLNIEINQIEKFKKRVEEKTAYEHFSYEILPGKNIQKELEDYSKNKSTDLLVVSTHHRTIIDKLFGKSITKQLTYHSSVPLLVFHHKQKPLLFIFGLAIMK